MHNDFVSLYFREKVELFNHLDFELISLLVDRIIFTYQKNGIVFTLGNGGGVSVANGFSVDLRTHPFTLEDKTKTTEIPRLRVVDFTESSGMLTGIANDVGGEFMFSEQFKNWINPAVPNSRDNTLVVFSGSGNSKNVIQAVRTAINLGVYTVCISGRGGGEAANLVDLPIVVPGSSKFPGQTGKNDNNFHIEDLQISIGHIIVGLLKHSVSTTYGSK